MTDYGLDSQGSNPSRDEIFRPSRPALGHTQPPVQCVPGLSLGLRRPGRGADPPPLLECRGPRHSRAIPLLLLRAFVAYKMDENLNIHEVDMHKKLTANGVLKDFVKKRET